MILHDVHIERVSDGHEIACSGISIQLAAGDTAWSVSADLAGADAAAAVTPDPGPMMVDAVIDGYRWRWIVTSVHEELRFGARTVRAEGVGLSSLLGGDWQAVRSVTSSADRTAQQLIDDELTAAAAVLSTAGLTVGTAWTVDWQPEADWLVPAGAWSYAQLTPAQAVARVAAAAGAVIVPGLADYSLTVRPRYSIAPWLWGGSVSPALEVPAAAMITRTRRPQRQVTIDGVSVSGGNVGGVLVSARLTGTAGSREAPPVDDALITDVAAARALAVRTLAAYYPQGDMAAATLPLSAASGDFPLISVCDLVRLDGQLAAVSGVKVDVTRGTRGWRVTQQITLGESPTGLDTLRRLVAPAPRLLGEITVDHGDGTVTVALVGGGTLRARGAGASSTMVYVRNGVIESTAPSLAGYSIDI